MKKLLQAASFAVLLTAVPVAAEAAETVVTVTGKIVTVHSDNTFGLSVGQNQSVPISLTFRYDPSLGTITGQSDYKILGGLGPSASPVRSVTIRIGNLSDIWSIVPVGSSYQTEIAQMRNPSYSQFAFTWYGGYYLNPDVGSSGGYDYTALSGSVGTPNNVPVDFTLPFVGPLDSGGANLTRQNSGANGAVYSFTLSFGGGTAIAGVPEPGTWALMIGGFGFAGAALRRRTVAAAA